MTGLVQLALDHRLVYRHRHACPQTVLEERFNGLSRTTLGLPGVIPGLQCLTQLQLITGADIELANQHDKLLEAQFKGFSVPILQARRALVRGRAFALFEVVHRRRQQTLPRSEGDDGLVQLLGSGGKFNVLGNDYLQVTDIGTGQPCRR
ncbi:hypothetical protein D3C79_519360 [compost metagenome]